VSTYNLRREKNRSPGPDRSLAGDPGFDLGDDHRFGPGDDHRLGIGDDRRIGQEERPIVVLVENHSLGRVNSATDEPFATRRDCLRLPLLKPWP
jgi:hypothetical protein